MKFYDFNISGKNYNNDYALLKEAQRLGYAGVSLIYSIDNFKESKDYLNDIKEQFASDFMETDANLTSFEIIPGLEIQAKNPEDLKKKVRKNRNKTDIMLVCGGDLKVNRAVCENSKVDILSRPYFKRRDCGINHVLAKEAARNNVAIELNVSDILKSWLTRRSKLLGHFREIIKLHRKFNFPLIITSGGSSVYDLRNPRDLIAAASCFGLENNEAELSLSKIPQSILEFNKIRKNMIVDGVQKIMD